MAKKPEKKPHALSIEEQFQEYFQYRGEVRETDGESLEQPSPLKVIPSVTTYDGAYEEPILGA